ncbi:hypothetical protein, partial [Kribbella ginsengisoli]|uniref:hypothetical protein n=1 Tax=Kribbella ginsengisoli TaxID=363865 RepID=UPI0031CDE138
MSVVDGARLSVSDGGWVSVVDGGGKGAVVVAVGGRSAVVIDGGQGVVAVGAGAVAAVLGWSGFRLVFRGGGLAQVGRVTWTWLLMMVMVQWPSWSELWSTRQSRTRLVRLVTPPSCQLM